MAAMSNYLENKLIDFLFRGISFSAPSPLHFALFTTAPTDAGTGTEVAGGGYARVSVTPNTINFTNTQDSGTAASTGTSGATKNNVVVQWPTAPTAYWGVVTHVAIYNAATSGELLWWAALANAKTINAGDPAPSFPVNSFVLTLDSDT